MKILRGRLRGERGASLVEYALLVALIAVVCIGAVTFLGRSGSNKLDEGGAGIDNADQTPCDQFDDFYNIGTGEHMTIHILPDDITHATLPGPCP